MSEKTQDKNQKSLDLDFDNISGGTETIQQVAPKPVKSSKKLEYVLPIYKDGDKTWEIKNLQGISGIEFLRWAEQVYPPLRSQRIDPSLYDGPRNMDSRIEAINVIATFYLDILIRKGYNSNTIH